jgi:hypothetical protein
LSRPAPPSYPAWYSVLWTEERVKRWHATGEIPGPVMVWTPEQFGRFRDEAEGDRLYTFFQKPAPRGGRRPGVTDVDLDARTIVPAKAIVVDNWDPYESDPKTDGSAARSLSTA